MNGKNQFYSGECKGGGSQSNVTVCEFVYKGREIPYPGDEKLLEAFGSSHLVNLTTSTGQTMESLIQLVQVREGLELLEEARMLMDDEEEKNGSENREPENQSMDVERKTSQVTSKD
mmetsp:Transcript_12924/g.35772  ORF Transcript_12924/g.35772 Transcript_12924/m.35772 type:complete len:117 (-) Transcript_12924:284-634(-)